MVKNTGNQSYSFINFDNHYNFLIIINIQRSINNYLFKLFYFSVARLATEKIGPLVRQMEDDGKIHESVLNMLFDNGVNNIVE